MGSGYYAGLMVTIIILLAFEYTSANGHQGNGTTGKRLSKTEEDVFLHSYSGFDVSGRKVLGGRKMLQRLGDKQSNIRGKNEPLSALTEPQKGSDYSKAWVEAADEVASLMRKDYKGTDRPRRKPPINNHDPNN